MQRALYWTTTALLIAELLAGGIADLIRARWAADVMIHLGYPLYMMTILGFWKVLAAVALAVPGFPRLRDWAYAGTFFEITGALASHLLHRDPVGAAISPLVFTALVVVSWKLNEDRRTAHGSAAQPARNR
jgi:hypothetical protein